MARGTPKRHYLQANCHNSDASIVQPLRKSNADEETNEKRSFDSRYEPVGQYIRSGAGHREQHGIVEHYEPDGRPEHESGTDPAVDRHDRLDDWQHSFRRTGRILNVRADGSDRNCEQLAIGDDAVGNQCADEHNPRSVELEQQRQEQLSIAAK